MDGLGASDGGLSVADFAAFYEPAVGVSRVCDLAKTLQLTELRILTLSQVHYHRFPPSTWFTNHFNLKLYRCQSHLYKE